MVSNGFSLSIDGLVMELRRIREEFSDMSEYQESRKELPEEWPM